MKKILVFICLSCLCATLITAQELQKKVNEAVDNLAMTLLRPLEVSIGAMTLQGKDTTGDFSLYLFNLVNEYATKNPSFRVVSVSRGPLKPTVQRGLIKGTFLKRGERVEVFLNLLSDPEGNSLASQRFDFPFAELSQGEQKIFLEPENTAAIKIQEEIFEELSAEADDGSKETTESEASNNQEIHIKAFFNKESMTYFHRDELKMTLLADKDCYFKVIHIDVENQMKMIYPNSADKNNSLRANAARTIFEKASYMLYEPYGAETMLVITSPKQFPNIEKEYLVPWISATAEEIRSAVKGRRGGEIENSNESITFTGEGEIKYSISILKPHEEYEFTKPENMKQFIRSMRDDAVKQSGSFEGNETSGFYIIGNVRGSYRVPRNKPDVIQFASYSLDAYASESSRSVEPLVRKTRGVDFNFSFKKPNNIIEAVETVRNSVLKKGGVFNGDEQQGDFKASGITGQYQVSELVNVTITDKPFIVPKSLIENEVKVFFGVK